MKVLKKRFILITTLCLNISLFSSLENDKAILRSQTKKVQSEIVEIALKKFPREVLSIIIAYARKDLKNPISIFREHTNGITCMTVLTNGNIVSFEGIGDHNDAMYEWNPQNMKLIKKYDFSHCRQTGITSLLPLPGGHFLTSKFWIDSNGYHFGRIEEWWPPHSEGADQNTIIINRSGLCRDGGVTCLALLPNGNYISTTNNFIEEWQLVYSPTIKTTPSSRLLYGLVPFYRPDFFHANLLMPILRKYSGHTGHITCLAPLLNGNFISGSDDRTINEWTPNNPNAIRTYQNHAESIRCLAVLPYGNFLSGSADLTIKEWTPGIANPIKTYKGHTGTITCLATLPNGNFISGSGDSTIKQWDPQSGKLIFTYTGHSYNNHRSPINCITALPDGTFLSGSWDRTIRIWDSETRSSLELAFDSAIVKNNYAKTLTNF